MQRESLEARLAAATASLEAQVGGHGVQAGWPWFRRQTPPLLNACLSGQAMHLFQVACASTFQSHCLFPQVHASFGNSTTPAPTPSLGPPQVAGVRASLETQLSEERAARQRAEAELSEARAAAAAGSESAASAQSALQAEVEELRQRAAALERQKAEAEVGLCGCWMVWSGERDMFIVVVVGGGAEGEVMD